MWSRFAVTLCDAMWKYKIRYFHENSILLHVFTNICVKWTLIKYDRFNGKFLKWEICHNVVKWKICKEIFRQINSLVKTLLSRNFCQKSERFVFECKNFRQIELKMSLVSRIRIDFLSFGFCCVTVFYVKSEYSFIQFHIIL